MKQAASWLLRNCEFDDPDGAAKLAMTAVPHPYPPWLKTGDLEPYTTARNPELVYDNLKKAHISHAVCNSRWEVKTARMLDQSPSVQRWDRNSRLGWTIPYLADGELHYYYPDFVAVCPKSDGTELHIVIELKGQIRDSDDLKRRWTEDHWIPAVNRHLEYGRAAGKEWRYLHLNHPDSIRKLPATLGGDSLRSTRHPSQPARHPGRAGRLNRRHQRDHKPEQEPTAPCLDARPAGSRTPDHQSLLPRRRQRQQPHLGPMSRGPSRRGGRTRDSRIPG